MFNFSRSFFFFLLIVASFNAISSDKHFLRISNVMEYACNYRELVWEPPHVIEYAKKHFYFTVSENPPSLPSNVRTPYCHDISRYGQVDSPLFPRLEAKYTFFLWDKDCSTCGDSNSNGKIDVNEEVSREFRYRT
ncbi:MAG: hypothetical protein NXH75_11950, partial [Halobacteriovoraceae bacterium]|nr:hypothetical protein [Halobacteriovoraceae bacterium]